MGFNVNHVLIQWFRNSKEKDRLNLRRKTKPKWKGINSLRQQQRSCCTRREFSGRDLLRSLSMVGDQKAQERNRKNRRIFRAFREEEWKWNSREGLGLGTGIDFFSSPIFSVRRIQCVVMSARYCDEILSMTTYLRVLCCV